MRHLSSSVYSVHKPSFGSIRFNKHLLNICAVSDHVQGTRAIRMKNTWTGPAVMLFYSFIVPQTLFTWLISINLVRSNRAHTGTAFPLHNGESWASERPSPSPKITRLINVSSGPRIRDSIFHSMFNTQFFQIAFFFLLFFLHIAMAYNLRMFQTLCNGPSQRCSFPLLIILHGGCRGWNEPLLLFNSKRSFSSLTLQMISLKWCFYLHPIHFTLLSQPLGQREMS